MHPDLERLIRLQALEFEIRNYSDRIESLPKKIAELESKLGGTRKSLETGKTRLNQLATDKRKLEGSIQDFEQRNSKYRSQLIEVKTNEQYRSLLNEIEFNNIQIRKIEDDILVDMEEEEKLRHQISQVELQLAREQAMVNTEKKEAEAEVEKDRLLLEQAQESRRDLVALIEPSLYETYTRIASVRKGVALARAADESCQACNVRIRPHLLSQVISGNEIVTCDSCSRILYWKPETPYEVSA